jgi:anti-sigma factor RsiW
MMHPGELLSAFLDSELDPTGRASIEAHVSECDACAHELDDLAVVRGRVRSLPVQEPPPGILEPLAPALPLRRHRRLLVTGAAAAAAALVVAIGLGANGNQSVPLPLDAVVDQHIARASVDPGFNVLQVQAAFGR